MRSFVLVLLAACTHEPAQAPELLVGGPYTGTIGFAAQPEGHAKERANEKTLIPHGAKVTFNVLMRAVYGRTFTVRIVDSKGTVCHEQADKLAQETFKSTTGWSGQGFSLPNRTTKCSEGEFTKEAFLPGRYTATFSVGDGVIERVFTVD